VNICVAVHTTAIESEDVKARRRFMTGQKIDMTFLAQLVSPSRQELLVI